MKTLGVHVVGGGIGEFIVLELGNSMAVVFDCFCPKVKLTEAFERVDENPLIRFLVRELRVKHLACVALTHPHQDHVQGAIQLLEHFDGAIEKLWVFREYKSQYLLKYFQALSKHNTRLDGEKALGMSPGTFVQDYIAFAKKVRSNIKERRLDYKEFCGYEEYSLLGGEISVKFLGPSSSLIDDYSSTLQYTLERCLDNDLRLKSDWSPKDVNHNLISPAVLIKFGKTKIILGGDMEQLAWDAAMHELGEQWLQNINFVKVSHHGSRNAFHPPKYKALTTQSLVPLGVITPYTRCRGPLPSSACTKLFPYFNRLYVTNLRAANRSMSTPIPRAVDSVFRRALIDNPSWAAFLHESLRSKSDHLYEPSDRVPEALAIYVRQNPSAATYLRPGILSKTDPTVPSGFPENQNRVSFYFNANGQELSSRRYVGVGAGLLNP